MSAAAPASVSVERLTHRYPGAMTAALDDVSFAVAPGQRLGLLGPNGAGKSTLMRILCGYLPIGNAARVKVADYDVRTQSQQVRRRVGYMPETVPLYPELRVREHLWFRAAIKRIGARSRARELVRVVEATGLGDVFETPIGKLSRGFRQRVGIADALLGSPPLLVLDEPTVGLDPNQILDIRRMLSALGGAQTLVFSSHILAEVEALCDRVVILAKGRTVLDAPLSEALASAEVVLEVRSDAARAQAFLAQALASVGFGGAGIDVRVPDVAQPDRLSVTIRLPHADVAALARVRTVVGEACLAAQVPICALVPGRPRLETRFAEVTGGQREHV